MPWDPSQPDRRSGVDRRAYSRGGRRKTDWPAGVTQDGCPRCGSAQIKFVEATPAEYFWQCHQCRHDWSSPRPSAA